MSRDKTAVEILMDLLTYDNGTGQRWSSYLDCTDLLPYFQKALELEKEQTKQYAEFSISCDRQNMKILNFEDWIKL
jgi:hypothetical protein